jgi:sirohydrochlorin cobaltochelatase
MHLTASSRRGLLTCALMVVITPVSAQTVGTLIVAHGADSVWNAAVLDMARGVRTGGPVDVTFLMGPAARVHRFQDAVAALAAAGATTIVVVPLLVSSHGGHYEQARYLTGVTDTLIPVMREHLAMSGIERPRIRVPLVVTRALDDAPELAQVLMDRARALTSTPRAQALFLIGHGPNSAEEKAAWMGHLRPLAETVRASTGFRDVHVGLVRDDAPEAVRADAVYEIRELITLEARITGKPVVVVPILIARGEISNATVPHDLEGLPITYGGAALLPHPALARWVERQVREAPQR